MTTLALNKPRIYGGGLPLYLNSLPVITNDIIYEGAAVGDDGNGRARPLVAADDFMGFAVRKVDNTGGAAAAKRVDVREEGEIEIAVTGVTGDGDRGSTVYASDDDTFTLISTGNSAIGKIIRHVSGTTVVVHFQSKARRSI